MRLCRFDDNRLGVVDGATVRDVTPVLGRLPAHRYPFPPFDLLIASLHELRPAIEEMAGAAPLHSLDDVTLLSPVANPGKIVAAPVNYQKHLDEVKGNEALHHQQQGHMTPIHKAGLFLKATSSLTGAGEGVVLRHPDRRNDHEVELALVIGTRADRVSRERAMDHVAGYCIGLDLSARGPEDRSFRKSIDTYTVLGPWLVTAEEIPEPWNLDLSMAVNGELRQKANTRELIVGIPELIEFASAFYTLHPGDILLTGTPDGVGPLQPGDIMNAYVERVGEMQVRVR